MTMLQPDPRTSRVDAEPASRRAGDRAVLQADILCERDDGLFFTGFADNISEGGVFIATHTLHELGEHIAVQLTLPGGGRIAAMGEVRWVRLYRETSDARPGVGLRFIDLSASGAALIADFVAQHGSLFWDDSDSDGLPGAMTLRTAPVSDARPFADAEAPPTPTPMDRSGRTIFLVASAGVVMATLAGYGFAPASAPPGAARSNPPPAATAGSEAAKAIPESTVRPAGAGAELVESKGAASAEPQSAGILQPEIDPASLLPAEGLLVVDAPEPADVYLNGKLLGETGATLRAPCGPRFMRLAVHATPPAPLGQWITRGESVGVACRALTRVNPSMTARGQAGR